MSDVIEKTIASLPKLFSDGIRGSPGDKSLSTKKLMGRAFHGFIRSVCRCRNLAEERAFVSHELEQIKENLSRTGVSQDSVCDYLCRLVFCHILGYDVSFGLIYTLKLAQQGSGLEKRIGYTTAMLLLHQDDELTLLLMNTIQKDLHSTNILDNCIALSAVCHLVSSDINVISMFLPLVQKKLQHPRELVRMKAACCILRFIKTIPSYQRHLQDNIRKLLYDKDPGVMSIGIKIQLELLRGGNQNSQNLTSDLIKIQQQIMNRSLPASFEYHGIPLPWLQIDILRVLAVLGRESKKNSEDMYPLLRDLLDKINMREKMAYALMYECIVTITSIFPHQGLLSEASIRVKKFISSTSYVLKYIGVRALTHLITVSPESTTDCQMIVVELLDDPDPAIQSKTVDLLYSMANESNVKVVCSKLVEHLDRPGSNFTKSELVRKIVSLTENKYNLDGGWVIDITLMILKVESNNLPENLVERLLNNLVKILDLPVQSSRVPETIQHAVKKSVQGLFQENCSKELVCIATWILSECSSLLKNMPEDKVMSLLQKQFLRPSLDVSTRLWILSCMTNLLCGGILKPGVVKEAVEKMRGMEQNFILQQKLLECHRLCGSPLTVDLHTERLDTSEFDFTLSFLDDFVIDSLENGTKPYMHRNLRMPQAKDALFSGFGESQAINESVHSNSPGKVTSPGNKSATSDSQNVDLKLEGVSKVWGEEGFLEQETRQGYIHNKESDEKQRELDKKRELAAALFSGFDIQNKVGEKETELQDPWSEEVPLTLNSTPTDWRALSAEETEKGDNSNEFLVNDETRTSTNSLDFSETKILSEQVTSSDGLLSVSEHNLDVDDRNKKSFSNNQLQYHEKDFNLEKAEFYSREPPPLCSEDFSEDGMSLFDKQPFSGCDEDMDEGSLMFSQENVESFSQLNLDTSQTKDEESDSLFRKTKLNSYSIQSDFPNKEAIQRKVSVDEDNLYSQYNTLSDSDDSDNGDNVS
ncbi:AP-4 complex subunit epsilon-1-like [Saccostrea echinata]|uniref:AP-4 complex subunit epsilon-1-like n=1 Tax=Saccostrea echinata TaxID=191078 RepID=UPI002A8176CF|nr:AP-4 complex subunit epsilon-1-like [Saccostrea echinata]